MNQVDLLTLVFSANEAGNMALGLYMTAISGYLIVAYTAGGELTRLQAVVVNTLFIFFSVAFAYSTVISFFIMRLYERRLAEMAEGRIAGFQLMEDIYVTFIAIGLLLGIAGALMFMARVRVARNDD